MKRNRSTLKEYFRKGSIPTESNFADLIDSMLNQEEDNLDQLLNGPLSVRAVGTDENLISFYRMEANEKKPGWQLVQKPGGKPGLSISEGTDSRLFIENGTGNIGLGVTKPTAKLEVNGNLKIAGTSSELSFQDNGQIRSADDKHRILFRREENTLELREYGKILFSPGATKGQETAKVTLAASGNVGINTTDDPKQTLDVCGRVNVENGVIQRGGEAITDTSDLGLYSQVDKNWIRIVSTNAPIRFYTDGGVGTNMALSIESSNAVLLGNSDLYFTKTDHKHTGFGNTDGYAAIENAADYDSLMILGRTQFKDGKFFRRVVKLWDYLEVNGELTINGSLFERLDVIKCGGRSDWNAQDHPIMEYFKNKLSGKPVGTMIRAIQDHPEWRGHYWQGWVDADKRIRVIHNYYNTGAYI